MRYDAQRLVPDRALGAASVRPVRTRRPAAVWWAAGRGARPRQRSERASLAPPSPADAPPSPAAAAASPIP